jgi:16S rRNA (guanine966-N2)-methyltransferase
VIAGDLRGRRLFAPRSGVRPTSDRVREATFASLGSVVEGARVLDLYAGTGALGIEALSRGAIGAVFVDRSPASVSALRRNLEALALAERVRVLRSDVAGALRRLGREGAGFDLVFADPPYAVSDVETTLGALSTLGLLEPDATLVVERGRRHPLAAIAGVAAVDERGYGDTVIVRLRPLAGGSGEETTGTTRQPGRGPAAGNTDRATKKTDSATRMTGRTSEET